VRELAGKIAVVTGGGSGIGRGMARAFAGAGMHVFVADIELAAAEAVAEEIGGTPIQTDVTDSHAVDKLADAAFAAIGEVHLLANNAGVAVGGPLADMTRADWQWLIGVNLQGLANCLTAFLPRMKKQPGEAHIVNTGSIQGLLPEARRGVYGATKSAVVALSEVLRMELAEHQIGVTVLCPGSVRTGILNAARNRPEELADTNMPPPARFTDSVGAIDPDALGRDVRDAVLSNQLYLVTLAEGRKDVIPAIKERFSAILKAMP